jgi:hypothetical protein
MRAAFSANLTGANVSEEMVYPNTRVDDKGAPLSGANRYVLRFVCVGPEPPIAQSGSSHVVRLTYDGRASRVLLPLPQGERLA